MQKTWGGSSNQASFSAHVVEDSHAEDAVCLHGSLLFSLSFWDFPWCLDEELCVSLSHNSWHSSVGGEHFECEDFLHGEPVVLGGSPPLLAELFTSSELRGG